MLSNRRAAHRRGRGRSGRARLRRALLRACVDAQLGLSEGVEAGTEGTRGDDGYTCWFMTTLDLAPCPGLVLRGTRETGSVTLGAVKHNFNDLERHCLWTVHGWVLGSTSVLHFGLPLRLSLGLSMHSDVMQKRGPLSVSLSPISPPSLPTRLSLCHKLPKHEVLWRHRHMGSAACRHRVRKQAAKGKLALAGPVAVPGVFDYEITPTPPRCRDRR